MKRLLAFALILSFVFCFVPFNAQAAETTTTVQYFEDGSYIVTEITVSNSRSITKVASKNKTYYDTNDQIQWKITVTGEFLYDGATATCTYSSGTYTIYATDKWQYSSGYSSYSGNSATYTATLLRLTLGIVVDRPTFSVTVTCDPNGNIS